MQPESRPLLLAFIAVFLLISITGCAPSSAVVQGKVFSGEHSLSNLTVHLNNETETVQTQTGEDGEFIFTDVEEGSRVITVETTIDGRECSVSTTVLGVENGKSVNVDIQLPSKLKPPEVILVAGVGYVAGDLNIIC